MSEISGIVGNSKGINPYTQKKKEQPKVDNFFKEQLKVYKFLKENSLEKIKFENIDVDRFDPQEVRLERGKIVATQKLYFPGIELTPHQQRDFDFYFTFMEQQPQSGLVERNFEKLRQFRSKKIPKYNFKKIPKF